MTSLTKKYVAKESMTATHSTMTAIFIPAPCALLYPKHI
jgi:hypothetical protein